MQVFVILCSLNTIYDISLLSIAGVIRNVLLTLLAILKTLTGFNWQSFGGFFSGWKGDNVLLKHIVTILKLKHVFSEDKNMLLIFVVFSA